MNTINLELLGPPGSVARWSLIDCILDQRDPTTMLASTWAGCDIAEVTAQRDATLLKREMESLDNPGEGKGHGLDAVRMREHREQHAAENDAYGDHEPGVPLTELAGIAKMRRETLVALLEAWGYVELVPYGRTQSRRLMTEWAIGAGVGRNIDGALHQVAKLVGFAKASVFPVVFRSQVESVLGSLGFEKLKAQAAALGIRRERLAWLLADHGYLPDAEVAELAGYSKRGVEEARKRRMVAEPV